MTNERIGGVTLTLPDIGFCLRSNFGFHLEAPAVFCPAKVGLRATSPELLFASIAQLEPPPPPPPLSPPARKGAAPTNLIVSPDKRRCPFRMSPGH